MQSRLKNLWTIILDRLPTELYLSLSVQKRRKTKDGFTLDPWVHLGFFYEMAFTLKSKFTVLAGTYLALHGKTLPCIYLIKTPPKTGAVELSQSVILC